MLRSPHFIRILAVFFVLLLSPVTARTALVTITSVNVRVTNDNTNPDEIRKLVPYKAGQKVDENEIITQMEELEDLETIAAVAYKLVPEKGGARLEVEILQHKIVRDIRVGGNYPFLNRDITRLIPLQPGSIYDPLLIPKSVENIDTFLEKNGFYDSQIAITAKPHRKYDTVDLVIKIRKGHSYRVDNVVLTGVKLLPERLVRNKISRSDRFRTAKLKKNLRKIKNLYNKKGFVKARIKLDKLEFKEDGKVDIFISVRENKRLVMEFAGKTAFPKDRLRSILNFEERRSYDRYSVRMSRLRLEQFYQQSGYPDVEIRTHTRKMPDEVRITYLVNPGRRVELAKIRFEGNKEFGGKHLKKRMLSQESKLMRRGQYRLTRLLGDVQRLEDYYRSKGYLDARVQEPNITTNRIGDQKTATYTIHEGEVYRLKAVRVRTDRSYNVETLLKKSDLKPEQEFTKEALDEAKVKVYEQIFSDGYAYAQVEFRGNIDPEKKTVDLTIDLTRGDKVFVRNIAVSGNNLTRQKTILAQLKMKPGDIFVYQKILDAQLNLRTLGIFSTVKIDTLGWERKSQSIDLHIFVNELKTNIAKVQAGFDNRSKARGEFSFTRRNLFGTAKQFNMRLIGGKKFNRAEGTLFFPRIFGASWNLANQYFAQYEDAPNFNAYSYGGFFSTLKNFGPHWTFGFKEGITRTDVVEMESNLDVLGDALFDNTFNEAGLFAIFDNRDNFSDPQKGFYILLRNDINTDLSDFGNNFSTARINISHYQGFLNRFTLNNTVRYGHNFQISESPRIPVNKLFFLGGSDTIRGFDEDAVDPSGGTFLFIYNAELHFRIVDAFKLAGFFDAGFLSNDVNAVRWSDFRESAGIGIRYFTPVGPIRLDYGFILDRREGEPTSHLHFSFGYFF